MEQNTPQPDPAVPLPIKLQPNGPLGVQRNSKAVRLHNFLPLYLGWFAALGILPDGTVVRWDHDDNIDSGHLTAPEHEPNPFWQRMALSLGARSYPALTQLIPSRPSNAIDCDACEGTGDQPICNCGGVGWLIPGEEQGRSPG
jgi:hypothetical protein